MFFTVDCIYRRYHTRSIVEINGLLHLVPNLSGAVILLCLFYSGIPCTVKFISEFYIFNGFFESSVVTCSFLMFTVNVVGIIGFSKCWFNSIFGISKKNMKNSALDLSRKESLVFLILFSLLFFSVFFFKFLF